MYNARDAKHIKRGEVMPRYTHIQPNVLRLPYMQLMMHDEQLHANDVWHTNDSKLTCVK